MLQSIYKCKRSRWILCRHNYHMNTLQMQQLKQQQHATINSNRNKNRHWSGVTKTILITDRLIYGEEMRHNHLENSQFTPHPCCFVGFRAVCIRYRFQTAMNRQCCATQTNINEIRDISYTSSIYKNTLKSTISTGRRWRVDGWSFTHHLDCRRSTHAPAPCGEEELGCLPYNLPTHKRSEVRQSSEVLSFIWKYRCKCRAASICIDSNMRTACPIDSIMDLEIIILSDCGRYVQHSQ